MRLLAIADLHLAYERNRQALQRGPDHLEMALEALTPRFAQLIWTPGNHDLWCRSDASDRTRGQARYDELVGICRRFGALTPEDPFIVWPGEPDTLVVPMFLLFDYSFRPPEVSADDALGWAAETGVVSRDESALDPDPWPSRSDWCHARCAVTAARLDALPASTRTVLVNHWPLRYDLARPPRIPRFSLWCGTTRTEDWAARYRARVVVSGHLHFRTTLVRHGVRYEEVSLGYPRDWRADRGVGWYLREILPGTSPDANRFVPARDPFR